MSPPTERAGIRPAVLVFLIVLNLGAGVFYFGRTMRPAVRIHVDAATETAPAKMRLPEFTLLDRSGRTVTRKNFEGKPWVADFIYTNCPAQCPMMTAKMGMLQEALPGEVGLASISVDPAHDSPQALAAFAERFRAREGWLFLTGAQPEIDKILSAFHAPRGSEVEAHSVRFYLLDPAGSVVGVYDTESENSIQNLLSDARVLTRGKP